MNVFKISTFLFFITFTSIYSEDIIFKADKLDFNGDYTGALQALVEAHKNESPNIKLIWRIGRETSEVANIVKTKEEKIKFYEEGIKFTKPFINITNGEPRDRAEIIHWYAVNYASKLKLQGIFAGRESFQVVPIVFDLMDKCIAIDNNYPNAYFFKAKLYREVPEFLGGNMVQMEIEYKFAIKKAEGLLKAFFMLEAAKSYLVRNWDINKKKSIFNKIKTKEISEEELNINDIDNARKLLTEGINMFNNTTNHSKRDIDAFQEATILLNKLNTK